MINLFERLDTDSLDFLRSQKIAGLKIPSIVMNDDGFLPADVTSPVQYYCDFKHHWKPLYFDKLSIPRFWRITASAKEGKIFDLNKQRAQIVFYSEDNSRFVKEVQWLDNKGIISWIDHYNSNGKKFAKTYYDNGKAVFKEFFADTGEVVISHYLLSDNVFVNSQKYSGSFHSWTDFVTHYLQQQNLDLSHIIYNTLNKPFFLSLNLKDNGIDSLFWHEAIKDDLPGNMKFLMKERTRTKHVFFQRYSDWIKYQQDLLQIESNTDFHFLGNIYPHPRGNKLRPNALILTNSDDIEHLTEIIQQLPNLHFYIAAITEMSQKLLNFAKYQNVSLYPNVTAKKVTELLSKCDFYFDINHYDEIFDAVRLAFEQNMLIVGFTNTLHNRQFIAEENIFDPNDVEGLSKKVLLALGNPLEMKRIIDKQRQHAGDVSVEDYQQTFQGLMNER